MLAKKFSLVFLFLFISMMPFASSAQLFLLGVSNESTVPSTVYPGDLVTLSFDVQNNNALGNVAKDINVSLVINENDFEPVKLSESINYIASKASKTVSLRFKVKDGVLPGNYTFPIFLNYTNATSNLSQKEEISFDVSTCNRLKVSNIQMDNFSPHNGDSVTISADIVNPCLTSSREVSVSLVPVTNSTVAPFIVTSGTVQKIGNIPSLASETVSFEMNLSDKVDAKTYVFSIDANCDSCSDKFSNTFSFLVLGQPELVFSNIEYSVESAIGNDKQIQQGSFVTLSVQLDNIGKEKAKAVKVAADFGPGVSGSDMSFLGNIDPDDSGAAIFNLSIAPDTEPGEHKGAIKVEYIDEVGNPQTFIQPYSLFVLAAPPTNPLVYIVILVLLIVALGVLYFIIKFVFRQLALRKQSR